MPLTEDVLRPTSDEFIIDENYAPGYITVDIDYKQPVVNPQPLDNDKTLREYHKYTKRGKYPCHRYPKELVHSSKLFAHPEMMSETTLRKFTGLTALQFWKLVLNLI